MLPLMIALATLCSLPMRLYLPEARYGFPSEEYSNTHDEAARIARAVTSSDIFNLSFLSHQDRHHGLTSRCDGARAAACERLLGSCDCGCSDSDVQGWQLASALPAYYTNFPHTSLNIHDARSISFHCNFGLSSQLAYTADLHSYVDFSGWDHSFPPDKVTDGPETHKFGPIPAWYNCNGHAQSSVLHHSFSDHIPRPLEFFRGLPSGSIYYYIAQKHISVVEWYTSQPGYPYTTLFYTPIWIFQSTNVGATRLYRRRDANFNQWHG
jgi:hypothetical protein